MGRVENGFND